MDYRSQLRHLVSREEVTVGEIAKAANVSTGRLMDALGQSGHLPMTSLLRIVSNLGGELAIRPEPAWDFLKGDAPPSSVAERRGSRLPTAGMMVEDPFGQLPPIPRDMDLLDLAKWLADEYVPYIECHTHCTAAPLCPYAEPKFLHRPTPDRKCGMMGNAIANFVVQLGSELDLSHRARIGHLITAACRYADLSLMRAQELGRAVSPNTYSISRRHQTFREYVGTEGVQLAAQALLETLRVLDGGLYLPIKWIFEGESELEFFPILLRARHGDAFLESRVLSMRGSGNVKNLRLLLRGMRQDGFAPVVVADYLESPLARELEKLERDGLVSGDNVFTFTHDFESSFPGRLLAESFVTAAGESNRRFVEEAVRRYEALGSRGFVSELEQSLREADLPGKDAKKQVQTWKIPAARHLAERLKPSVLSILSREWPREPEIASAIRMVVRDVNWYKAPTTTPASEPPISPLGDQQSAPEDT